MDALAVVIAVIAIVAAIGSTAASSVRNEAHHQVTIIQDLLKEISEVTHSFFLDASTVDVSEEMLGRKSLAFESVCSMKCDLLESTLSLLVRRCASMFFFDADVRAFNSDFVELLGKLRDVLSRAAYAKSVGVQEMYAVDACLVRLHIRLNDYISERFRPVFESRRCD
jgi:hypothetical protein